jgi:hypothetical protein
MPQDSIDVVPDIVEDDEEDDEEDDLMMENPLVDLLVTSDGVNVADAVDRIARHLDAQNKIFIKLYSLLSKFQPQTKA